MNNENIDLLLFLKLSIGSFVGFSLVNTINVSTNDLELYKGYILGSTIVAMLVL